MMKDIRISLFLFLFANICFADNYPDAPLAKIEQSPNSYILIFDGTNQYNVKLINFVDFIRTNMTINCLKCSKGPKGENGMDGIEYVTINVQTNKIYHEYLWELTPEYREKVMDYYDNLTNEIYFSPEPPIVTYTTYDATNFFSNPSNYFKLSTRDITWYIKDFHGKVYVDFIVEEYGLSQSTKRALEQEISEAIQRIIDIHFPSE